MNPWQIGDVKITRVIEVEIVGGYWLGVGLSQPSPAAS